MFHSTPELLWNYWISISLLSTGTRLKSDLGEELLEMTGITAKIGIYCYLGQEPRTVICNLAQGWDPWLVVAIFIVWVPCCVVAIILEMAGNTYRDCRQKRTQRETLAGLLLLLHLHTSRSITFGDRCEGRLKVVASGRMTLEGPGCVCYSKAATKVCRSYTEATVIPLLIKLPLNWYQWSQL